MLPPIVSVYIYIYVFGFIISMRLYLILTLWYFSLFAIIISLGFTVRPGREAKFEKRWADRSSRLASLDGFKYFHLMRRVGLDDEVNSGKIESMAVYILCWQCIQCTHKLNVYRSSSSSKIYYTLYFLTQPYHVTIPFIYYRQRSSWRHWSLWKLRVIYNLVWEETFQCMASRRCIQRSTWRDIPLCIRYYHG